jgi:hypothetical protein
VVVSGAGRAFCVGSDAERYGITYVNDAGEEVGCVIVHTSIGSLERLTYGLLESAMKRRTTGLSQRRSNLPVNTTKMPPNTKFIAAKCRVRVRMWSAVMSTAEPGESSSLADSFCPSRLESREVFDQRPHAPSSLQKAKCQ